MPKAGNDLLAYGARIGNAIEGLTGEEFRQYKNKLGYMGLNIYEEEIRRDAGGDMRLSGWGHKKPVKLSARFKVRRDGVVEVYPVPIGIVAVMTDGRTGRSGNMMLPGRRTRSDRIHLRIGNRYPVFTREKPLRLGPTRGMGTGKRARIRIYKGARPIVEEAVVQGMVRKMVSGG